MDKQDIKACNTKKNTKNISKQQLKISNFFNKVELKNSTGSALSKEDVKVPLLKKRKIMSNNSNETGTIALSLNLKKTSTNYTNGETTNHTNNEVQKNEEIFFDETDFCIDDTWHALDVSSSKNTSQIKQIENVTSVKVSTGISLKNNIKDSSSSKKSEKISMIDQSNFQNGTNIKEKIDNDVFADFEIDDLFDDDWSGNTKVADLSSYKRCEVLEIVYHKHEALVTVKDIDSERETVVRCKEFWRDVNIKKNQICTIKAKQMSGQWIIDNNNGFLINDPDTLLAGTTIVNGLFCARRSVLQEIFNGLQTLPHYEPDALALTTGVISHEILQEALQNQIYTSEGITEIYNRKMTSNKVLNILYANNLTIDQCHKHTEPYLNQIFNFIETYVKGKTVANMQKLQCSVDSIHDIEENIWLPKLGLKGKIDITAEVNIHSKRKITPIEIKTGRPLFSIEHKGQVMLYILMMQLTGRDVDSGLLLYLKNNAMQEIKGSHRELRDLILLRNKLTHYFSNKLETIEIDEENKKYTLKLPEPINHPACERCPIKTVCCTFLTKEESQSLTETHYLKKIYDKAFEHLSLAHIEYVLKWTVLLQLEQIADKFEYPQSCVWLLDPETREKSGNCISNLKIISKVVEENEKYIHVFTRQNNVNDINFNLLDFTEDEYVIVSTNNRVNITAGKIRAIEDNTVTLNLNKNILTLFPDEIYHIDKYCSASLISFNNYGNIGGLLDDHEICAKLRSIVIDKTPASFANELPTHINTVVSKCIKSLNAYQQKAIIKVMIANDYMLIKGMPGTGKTQTLIVLIELLAKLGKSVLVTAHTNSAVDNILLKLYKKNIDFLRLGSTTKIHPTLRSKSETVITANCKTPEAIHAAYCSKNIVGVTCYSASHPLLAKRLFDVCIVDESTQVLQSTILRPLYSASKFVLVGDPEQLPPITRSKEARKLGLNESLFQRLDRDNNSVSLRVQYRMNSRIMDVANKLTYEDNLIAANEMIANATLKMKDHSVIQSSAKWIQTILSKKLEDSAIIVDTTPTWLLNLEDYIDNSENVKAKDFLCNFWETSIIIRLVDTLLKSGIDVKEIGIISPYRVQVSFMRKNIYNDVEINTVDQYQGRDKEVIIYSCAKSAKASKSKKEFDLLQDHSRLTVAVTRAKHKLVIIGDKLCLEQFSPFKKLFMSVKDEHVITLKDGQDNFSWKELMKAVKI